MKLRKWEVAQPRLRDKRLWIKSDNGRYMVDIDWDDVDRGEQMEIAELIAAAPELLMVLRGVMGTLHYEHMVWGEEWDNEYDTADRLLSRLEALGVYE